MTKLEKLRSHRACPRVTPCLSPCARIFNQAHKCLTPCEPNLFFSV